MATKTVRPQADEGPQAQNEIRSHVHGAWAAVAGAWGEHAGYADERGAALTEVLLDRAVIRPGDRVLELACGPGGAGLSAAARVAPDGEVVLSDVVAEMTAIAAERATARGITNVHTLVLDLEEIDQPDASYDAVLCREGLMFAVDPARAAGEIRRVLRPGGRVSIAVWGPREENPWLGLVFEAVSEQLGRPVPPPGVPGPFSLGDGDDLAQLLSAAGFADVAVTEHATPLRAGSFDEWWDRTRSLAGPLSTILAAQPQEALHALRTRLSTVVRRYETADGIELPGLSLLGSARVRE
jgi:enediyne biosynthesis protein CalE5